MFVTGGVVPSPPNYFRSPSTPPPPHDGTSSAWSHSSQSILNPPSTPPPRHNIATAHCWLPEVKPERWRFAPCCSWTCRCEISDRTEKQLYEQLYGVTLCPLPGWHIRTCTQCVACCIERVTHTACSRAAGVFSTMVSVARMCSFMYKRLLEG